MAILDATNRNLQPYRGNYLNDIQYSQTTSCLQLSKKDMRNEYALVREIGRGYYGVVRECKNRITGEVLACKTMKKERIRNPQSVVREIRIMSRLSEHENVVSFKEAVEDDRHVHILMEYCAGGDLCDEINRRLNFPEAEAASTFYQIVNAVSFCHSKGIMHRDLKPENILLMKPTNIQNSEGKSYTLTENSCPNDGELRLFEEEDQPYLSYGNRFGNALPRRDFPVIKLADFGQAVFLKLGQFTEGVCGSIYYLAPELVLGSKYGHAADIWSLGIILYCLLSGRLPFRKSDKDSVHKEICKGQFDFTSHPFQMITEDAKDLLRKMLVVDPTARISASSVLKHPWLSKFCMPPSPHLSGPLNFVDSENSKPAPPLQKPYSATAAPLGVSKHFLNSFPLRLNPELNSKRDVFYSPPFPKESPPVSSLIPKFEALLSTPPGIQAPNPAERRIVPCDDSLCSKCSCHPKPEHPYPKEKSDPMMKRLEVKDQSHNFNFFPHLKNPPVFECVNACEGIGNRDNVFGRDLGDIHTRNRLEVA